MSPDDPRHGTHRGYIVGCRNECCTRAHARYMKLYRMGRVPSMIDATGTIRRIQALQAIGWNCRDIGLRCNKGYEWARMVARSRMVTTTTAFTVAKVYDAICMTVPEGCYADRTRRHAARKGYVPPLAWDDIDDPDETPTDWRYEPTDRREALRDLADMGMGITEAARRLHLSRDAVERWCARHGMSDVYRKLAAREALRENQHTRGAVA